MTPAEGARSLEEGLQSVREHLEGGRAEEAAALVSGIVAELERLAVNPADVPRLRALWTECNGLAERSLVTLAEAMQRAATGRRAVAKYGEER